MFNYKHYVPILKGREGEYGALQMMPPQVRNAVSPVIEIPPIPWDHTQQQPQKTIDKHLRNVTTKIESAWGPGRRLFVDLLWISERERMSTGVHPMTYIFDGARIKGLQLVPVTGLVRDDDYQSACRDVIARDKRGACLRLQREDFEDGVDLEAQVSGLRNSLQVPLAEMDLILDLRGIDSADESPDESNALSMIQRLPNLSGWRSFTLAATSFPVNLMGLAPSQTTAIRRREWRLWRSIIAQLRTRLPAFSDYAISHPEPSEVDPRLMRPSASIRYTAQDTWLIFKAKNLRDHGYSQFHAVCRDVSRSNEYTGPDYSWGDWYIHECGQRRVKSGNLTTWRKVGTSHHLALVATQIASLA